MKFEESAVELCRYRLEMAKSTYHMAEMVIDTVKAYLEGQVIN